MQSFSSWLKPTLLGPLLTLWLLTTAGAFLIGMQALSGGMIDSWLVGMLWATFFGSTLGVILVGVDVALLKAKVRRLPTGLQAWIGGVLTPFGVFSLWQLPFFGQPETVLGLVAFLMLPMVGAALAVRLVFGSRP